MKTKLPYDHMLSMALPVVEVLRPRCKRIEIAGSLRRQKAEIGDIEIVAEPNGYMLDLLGEPTETHSLDTFDWSTLGKLTLNGHKQKKIILPGDVQVDLFIVTPPAQWGVIFLLRTGSREFGKRCCHRPQRGAVRKGDGVYFVRMKDEG